MDTSSSGYGRCGDCGEIKQVTDGALHAHNRYRANGTSVATDRCPGSDRRPEDTSGRPPSGRLAS